MNNIESFLMPDEISFLEFFGTEPVEIDIDNGFWCYKYVDCFNNSLLLSFNIFEKYIQTVLLVKEEEMITVSHENAVSLKIHSTNGKKYLRGEFNQSNSTTVLEIFLKPKLSVKWGTLRK